MIISLLLLYLFKNIIQNIDYFVHVNLACLKMRVIFSNSSLDYFIYFRFYFFFFCCYSYTIYVTFAIIQSFIVLISHNSKMFTNPMIIRFGITVQIDFNEISIEESVGSANILSKYFIGHSRNSLLFLENNNGVKLFLLILSKSLSKDTCSN